MLQVSNGNFMILIIGRPVLNGQWQQRSFPTRDITWQEKLRNEHPQVHIYPVPPLYNLHLARQLLAFTRYTILGLYVSLLELDHQQCTSIVNSLTSLFVNLPNHVDIYFNLEYEMLNTEHHDAIQQARDVIARRRHCFLFAEPNHQIEAISQMAVKGDDSPPADGSPPEDEDD